MIKLRLFTLTIISVLLSLPSMAQQSVLWRVTGNGLTKPSYLFGQMDYICPHDYLWTKSMADCFAKSDKVCLQVNAADGAVLKKISDGLVDRSGKKLEDYFSPADYIAVKQYAKDTFHLVIANVQALKPVALQPFIIKQLLGCVDAVSYDKRLMEDAQKAGKEIKGLETAEDVLNEIQVTHFNEKVAAVLAEMASGSSYYHQYRAGIMEAYKLQDIKQINTVFKTAKSFTLEDFNVFLSEKTKRWVSRMPAMMQQSSVFFSLNAINFWGDDGIITMLKKAGYTVEPVL